MPPTSNEPKCFSCGQPLGLAAGTNVPRGEICNHCGYDVRVCLNCQHYESSAYNQCKEPIAERVVDKDRSNFCDYFRLAGLSAQKKDDARESALKKLDALFKK